MAICHVTFAISQEQHVRWTLPRRFHAAAQSLVPVDGSSRHSILKMDVLGNCSAVTHFNANSPQVIAVWASKILWRLTLRLWRRDHDQLRPEIAAVLHGVNLPKRTLQCWMRIMLFISMCAHVHSGSKVGARGFRTNELNPLSGTGPKPILSFAIVCLCLVGTFWKICEYDFRKLDIAQRRRLCKGVGPPTKVNSERPWHEILDDWNWRVATTWRIPNMVSRAHIHFGTIPEGGCWLLVPL